MMHDLCRVLESIKIKESVCIRWIKFFVLCEQHMWRRCNDETKETHDI